MTIRFLIGMVSLNAYHRALFMKTTSCLTRIKVESSHLEIRNRHRMSFQIALQVLEDLPFISVNL